LSPAIPKFSKKRSSRDHPFCCRRAAMDADL